MAPNAALNSETICDLSGKPLDRSAAAFLKAIDQLLTVGAYYSANHEQYKSVSEKTCEQVVMAIRPNKTMVIEITASGMQILSQVVDSRHRNVRLLYDLLVPLNIARLEISAGLTPEDLRLTISTLQEHKQNLGNTSGFQEIKIKNLPSTVDTASRDVVAGSDDQDNADEDDDDLMTLDQMFGGDTPDEARMFLDEMSSDSEKLAREFMNIVNRILGNLEQDESESGDNGLTVHPESTPENITILRKALRRLVEVNPDPGELAHLIENAKRALDLSKDPGSVDLVFSLLKKEADRGGDWRNKVPEKAKDKPIKEHLLTLEQLKEEVGALETSGSMPAGPGPSALNNYLGICFHMLASEPSESLEISLVTNLERAIARPDMTKQGLSLCSAAMVTAVLKEDQAVIDSVLPAFCNPLLVSRPEFLIEFWTKLWESLADEHRALVWPHLVSDLLRGLSHSHPETGKLLWVAASELDSKTAIMQVSRLERTLALREQEFCLSLMNLPLATMYSVHLALMKSSQASVHGPRIHDNLRRHPPNDLTKILMKVLRKYDPDNDSFFLSLIKQGTGNSISPDLRMMSARVLRDAVVNLPEMSRRAAWVPSAISWIGKLDPGENLPLMTRILDEKKFFFFKIWPRECREQAEIIVSDAALSVDEMDGS
jgi:hypothetical protein